MLFACLILVALAGGSMTRSAWETRHKDYVILYEHSNYSGRSCADSAVHRINKNRGCMKTVGNDRISSIKVCGNRKLVLYDNDTWRKHIGSYYGAHSDGGCNYYAAGRDKVSSYKIEFWQAPERTIETSGDFKVTFYTGYGTFCESNRLGQFTKNQDCLETLGNDQISSLKVCGNAKVMTYDLSSCREFSWDDIQWWQHPFVRPHRHHNLFDSSWGWFEGGGIDATGQLKCKPYFVVGGGLVSCYKIEHFAPQCEKLEVEITEIVSSTMADTPVAMAVQECKAKNCDRNVEQTDFKLKCEFQANNQVTTTETWTVSESFSNTFSRSMTDTVSVMFSSELELQKILNVGQEVTLQSSWATEDSQTWTKEKTTHTSLTKQSWTASLSSFEVEVPPMEGRLVEMDVTMDKGTIYWKGKAKCYDQARNLLEEEDMEGSWQGNLVTTKHATFETTKTECPFEPWLKHEFACISGQNLGKFTGKSLEACQEICEGINSCEAIEFGVDHGQSNFAVGDCMPQGAASPIVKPCTGNNVDLYVRNEAPPAPPLVMAMTAADAENSCMEANALKDGYVQCYDARCQHTGHGVKTLEQCKQLCCEDDDCKAISWNPSNCFTKPRNMAEAKAGGFWYQGSPGEFPHGNYDKIRTTAAYTLQGTGVFCGADSIPFSKNPLECQQWCTNNPACLAYVTYENSGDCSRCLGYTAHDCRPVYHEATSCSGTINAYNKIGMMRT